MKRAPAIALRIAIALVVIVGVVWWIRRDKSSAPRAVAGGSASPASSGGDGKPSDRVVPVQLAPVTSQDFPIWLEGLGTVAAFQQVTVRAQVDGRIYNVMFE